MPDTRSPEFLEQAHREAELIASSDDEADAQAFIDSHADWDGLSPYDEEPAR